MKNLISLFAVLALLVLPTIADAGNENDPGVENGTCWEDSDGNVYTVAVRGNTMGEKIVTQTDSAGNSGESACTPDEDGGAADGPPFTVNGKWYQVKDGEMQERNDDGDYRDMDEVDCPEKKKVELSGGEADADEHDEGDSEDLLEDDTIGGWPIEGEEHVEHP